MSMRMTFRRSAIHLALVAIFPVSGAWADEDVAQLISPDLTEASINLPYYTNVKPLYRQYDGVSHDGFSPNVDLNIVRRSDEAVWFKLNARNLGLRTQEMGVSYEKQGDWAIGLDYNQIPRYSPYDVMTAVSGVGTNTITQPNIANTAAAANNPNLYEVNLRTERDITTLTASKFIAKDLKLGFSFKNEDKTGLRMDGVRGVAGTGVANLYSGFLFTPEPIDQNHKQFEAMLDYAGKNYQVTAGYYGSFLSTKYNALNVIGGTNTALVASAVPLSPIALAPDNSMQQFYVNGAYNFSADTRANLKVAYSENQQDDSFLTGQPTLAGVGPNLGGKVQTTEVYSSVTSRVTKDLKLLASWRYEDRRDKTPVVTYYSTGVTNSPESHVANWGKFEADYRLGAGYSVTAGADYTNKSSLQWDRHKVTETTTRLALRKTMSETVNGTLAVSHAERTGSDWITTTTLPLYPVYLADRTRNKVRAMVDWAVTEALNLQAAYEAYFDDYRRSTYGLDSGQGQVVSLDGSYVLNDRWKMNAWYAKQVGESKQYMQGQYCSTANCVTKPAKVPWNANLTQNGDQVGFGVTGKYMMVDLGAQYLFTQDRGKQEISVLPADAVAGIGVLPDTKYTQSTLRLNGIYPVSKATKVRLDYIYDVRKMDDYTWTNWVYADGTRVYVKPEQTVQVIGLTLTHAF